VSLLEAVSLAWRLKRIKDLRVVEMVVVEIAPME